MRVAALSRTLLGCAHVPPGTFKGPPGELPPEDLAPIVEGIARARLVLSIADEKALPLTRAALSAEGQRLWGVCLSMNEECRGAPEGRCLDRTLVATMKDGQRPFPLSRPPPARHPPKQLLSTVWAVGLVSLFLPMWWVATGTAPSPPAGSEPHASEVAAWEALAAEQRASDCSLYLSVPEALGVTLSLDFPRAQRTCRVWLSVPRAQVGRDFDRALKAADMKHVDCFEKP